MEGQQATNTPTGLARIIGDLIEHSEKWGKIWFGLIFWSSVLFAAGQRIWPDTSNVILLCVSLVVGLTGGVFAHIRGYWL